ncbi:YihY/virulence factor BrkB family protein [Vulgatibacter incomptus]|uniref:Ribonuclease BN n=1 Tax=Vulgatibacter incomptus TaxID=1391653 RepID=A0A0K1PF47_9BACT|nr:YihY/virulence factor BrkB family protein [Vulgatibacter incomptus]AKU92158.1 Ribonuclease BN [Vulgatibacter incomptus]
MKWRWCIPHPRILAHRLFQQWREDDATDLAAALAFYAILALFPFLIFLVALATIVFRTQIEENLLEPLQRLAPTEATKILRTELKSLVQGSTGLLTLGAVGAFWAASSGFAALSRGLNRIYRAPKTRPFWKERAIAAASTLGAALMVLVSGLLLVVIPAIADTVGKAIGNGLLWLRFPVSAAMMMVILAVLYHVLPETKAPIRLITPGSVVAVLVWILASHGFAVYVSHLGSYDITYGTLGGFVILLVWMWISSIAIFLGAELNVAWDRACREDRRRED